MFRNFSIFKRPVLGLMLLLASVAVFAPSAVFADQASWIDVKVEGEGPSVILIPGLSSSSDVWTATAAALKPTHRVHLVQVKGFADSAAAQSMDSDGLMAGLTAQLAEYITTHTSARPTVIGHSMGGYLALRLSRDHPTLIGKIVIVDALPFYSTLFNPAATAEGMKATATGFKAQVIAGAAQDPAQRRPQQSRMLSNMVTGADDLNTVTDWAMQSDAKVVGQAVFELMTSDLRGDLAGLKTPSLVLAAWAPGGPFSQAQTLGFWQGQYAAHPTVIVETVSSAKHFIMLDQPDVFITRIKAFLTES